MSPRPGQSPIDTLDPSVLAQQGPVAVDELRPGLRKNDRFRVAHQLHHRIALLVGGIDQRPVRQPCLELHAARRRKPPEADRTLAIPPPIGIPVPRRHHLSVGEMERLRDRIVGRALEFSFLGKIVPGRVDRTPTKIPIRTEQLGGDPLRADIIVKLVILAVQLHCRNRTLRKGLARRGETPQQPGGVVLDPELPQRLHPERAQLHDVRHAVAASGRSRGLGPARIRFVVGTS